LIVDHTHIYAYAHFFAIHNADRLRQGGACSPFIVDHTLLRLQSSIYFIQLHQIDDIEAESLQGMLTVAKEARVKHIIYSSAESGSTIR
jgi:hypothetical protein